VKLLMIAAVMLVIQCLSCVLEHWCSELGTSLSLSL